MLKQVDHIGIAVKHLEEHVALYRDVFGFAFVGYDEVPEQKVKIAAFKLGDVKLELLEPTSPESAIAKHIEKRGEGIHHVAFRSDDINADLGDLSKKVAVIDSTPRPGAFNSQIAFLHPKATKGVLIELCEPTH